MLICFIIFFIIYKSNIRNIFLVIFQIVHLNILLRLFISGISAFTTASNNVSIIFLPFTNTNGFGVLRVIGTSLDPKPAAKKIALLTL